MDTISRVPIREEWTKFEGATSSLFDECSERLGYDVKQVTKGQEDSARLNLAMKKAGIEYLNLKEVRAYKDKQWMKARKFQTRIGLHVTLFLLANGLYIYLVAFPKIEDQFLFWFPLVLENVLVLGVLGGLAIWVPGPDWNWRQKPLKGYTLPVPEFALNYALALSKVEPNLNFYVEELRAEHRVADPFLLAEYGSKQYYIAVWDEPKFEGRNAA